MFEKKNFIYLIIFLSFGFSTELPAGDLLSKAQAKFSSLKDLKLSFKATTGKVIKSKGTYYFKKENKSRVELNSLTLITDGITTWSYTKKEKKVLISNYREDDISLLSLPKILTEYPKRCIITEEKYTVILRPETQEFNFNEIKLYFSTDYLPIKAEITDMQGEITTTTFTNIQTDIGLKDELFQFIAPEGTKVIDLR